jgi:glycosyltransferase involved in cell wall biosynthesis
MYKGKRVSVIFPAHNEESNIYGAIIAFQSSQFVDEVIVVDNNSTDGTKIQIQKTTAIYIFEKRIGYGQALITGLKQAKSELIITVEPDGTFIHEDIEKLLAYSDEFSVVFGSRTSSSLIWEKAYMPGWVRFGNWVCAKELEVLFSGPSLSDVGCTYKLIHKSALDKILPKLHVKGSHFSPHFMINAIKLGFKCVEIPVNYKPRIGSSKITGGNVLNTIKLGLYMFFFIIFERIRIGKYF